MNRGDFQDRQGFRNRPVAFALMAAMFLPVTVLCLGLGVEVATLSSERTKAQEITDVAAILAAQSPDDPEAAVRAFLSSNGYNVISSVEMERLKQDEKMSAVRSRTQYEIILGGYSPAPDSGDISNFVAGHKPHNAARVSVRKKTNLYFIDRLIEGPTVSVSAIARRHGLAAFSVGSRTVEVNEGLLNQLLSVLMGAEIELSALDYRRLMETDIEVFEFLNALANELDIEAGRYGDILENNAPLQDVIAALAAVSGNVAVSYSLSDIHSAIAGVAGEVDLTKVLGLGPAGAVELGKPVGAGLPTFVSAFELVFAHALVADGERFMQIDLSASAPNIESLVAAVDIGGPTQSSPWLAIGEAGQTVSNVQVRLYIEASVGGEGSLAGSSVRLPFYMELARPHGELKSVECPDGRTENLVVRVEGSSPVVDAWIGDVSLSSTSVGEHVKKARLVSAPSISIRAEAHAAADEVYMQRLDFTWPEITNGTIETTRAEDSASMLVNDLVGDLTFDANILGLGLPSDVSTEGDLHNALNILTGPVGNAADELLMALGVGLGEGGYRVNGATCDYAVLVE